MTATRLALEKIVPAESIGRSLSLPQGMSNMPEVVPALESPSASAGPDLEQLVVAHFRFIWRLLRRLGLPSSDADDAAQQVFLIASGKLALIRAGRERAFLYGCALHLAAKWRRNVARQRQEPSLDDDSSRAAGSPDMADDLLERARARALLDSILGELPESLRSVFVLYEIEQLSTHEIADLLGLPRGTVASRLRRARAEFEKQAQRAAARASRPQRQRTANEERDDV
jgi:RNA polymerase sigma-70 factor, ECF subfamily